MTMLAIGNGDDATAAAAPAVTVGSKAFTESVILGEAAAMLAHQAGCEAEHIEELGGTRILWTSLLAGEIDLYPEYVGTIREELFRGEILADDAALRRRLAEQGVVMSGPLGFNNTYALGLKRSLAESLGVTAISDLKKHPQLKFGFSSEFIDRSDGWPSLKKRYGLAPAEVAGMDHALAYRALDAGDIGVTDLFATDPNIRLYDLLVLKDDLGHFPRYDAVFLYREDLQTRAPAWLAELRRLEGAIDDATMLDLNQRVELAHQSEARAAAGLLQEKLGIQIQVSEPGLASRLWRTTRQHLFLVVISLLAAIAVSVPLGIAAARHPVAGQLIVGVTEIIQTVPGLALLVFMGVLFLRLDLPSIGPFPVIIALFLYSLLPIIRNTMTGLTDVPHTLKESATALGLGPWSTLWLIELPLASRLILAGIKTTAVINVGYAALGGLIGAGGYGQPIMTGLRLNSEALMLEGAVPAAVMALAVKWLFELAERFIVPAGLRIKAGH